MRDFKRLQNDPPQGIDGSPNPENIMLWNAIIFGPEDRAWDGGATCCAEALAVPQLSAACKRLSPALQGSSLTPQRMLPLTKPCSAAAGPPCMRR